MNALKQKWCIYLPQNRTLAAVEPHLSESNSSSFENKCEQTEQSLCCLSYITIEFDRVRFMSSNGAVEVSYRCGFLGGIYKWQQRVQQPERKTFRNVSLTISKKALFYVLFGTW